MISVGKWSKVLHMTSSLFYYRALSLIGNSLQCNGCTQLIRPLVSLCESSSFNAIKMDTEGPVSATTKEVESVLAETTPKSIQSAPPKVGEPSPVAEPSTSSSLPPLVRLDLRDNAIDPHGVCNEGEQTFEPVLCMRAIKRYFIISLLNFFQTAASYC